MIIRKIHARQIFDSRGNPTVEVDVITKTGRYRAGVPSGITTGIYEAFELRDNDKSCYMGKAVGKAIVNINQIIGPEIEKQNFTSKWQKNIDQFMIDLDGTPNKSKLGANAILGVSIAVAKAGAAAKGVPLYQHIAELAGNKGALLPIPVFNVINGGIYANNSIAVREFEILPIGASSFSEAMKIGTEVYHTLKNTITKKFGLVAKGIGDKGGFILDIKSCEQGFEMITDAIKIAGYEDKVKISINMVASEFYKSEKYDLDFKNPNSKSSSHLSGDELTQHYIKWIEKYPIITIEDPFDQDDWESWTKFCRLVNIQVVGDDLTVTNPKRIQTAIDKKACNSLIIKANQIGTITEVIEAHNLAKANGWNTIVADRSGETEDSFIADLVVGLCAGQIKAGAPCRSERLSKYNQILRIEEELRSKAVYAGKNFRLPRQIS